MQAVACLLHRMYHRRIQDHVAEVKPHPTWRSCFVTPRCGETCINMTLDDKLLPVMDACDIPHFNLMVELRSGLKYGKQRSCLCYLLFTQLWLSNLSPFKCVGMRPPYTHVGMHWHPLMEDPANTYVDRWAWKSMVIHCHPFLESWGVAYYYIIYI